MKKQSHVKLAVITGVLALSATPALAAGPPSGVTTGPPSGVTTGPPSGVPTGPPSGVPENPGSARIPSTPGPNAGLPAKAKAYGMYCEDQSKKRVDGEKGTPFSKCVTAMAKLANGVTDNPRTACKDESKQPVEGVKGTPFSLCVAEGAQLLQDLSE